MSGIPAHFLLCCFYLGIPTRLRSLFFSHFTGRNLIPSCFFFPTEGKKNILCGLLKANHCLPSTTGMLVFLAPCQFR